MSNNVTQLRPVARVESLKKPADPEPTALQRAVLVRARELRERDHQPRTRSLIKWVTAAVLAIASFGLMFGAVDAVLRKMQHLAEDFATQAPPAAAPVQPAPQAQAPNEPYFIDLRPAEEQR